jgi:hypothetical protein
VDQGFHYCVYHVTFLRAVLAAGKQENGSLSPILPTERCW